MYTCMQIHARPFCQCISIYKHTSIRTFQPPTQEEERAQASECQQAPGDGEGNPIGFWESVSLLFVLIGVVYRYSLGLLTPISPQRNRLGRRDDSRHHIHQYTQKRRNKTITSLTSRAAPSLLLLSSSFPHRCRGSGRAVGTAGAAAGGRGARRGGS